MVRSPRGWAGGSLSWLSLAHHIQKESLLPVSAWGACSIWVLRTSLSDFSHSLAELVPRHRAEQTGWNEGSGEGAHCKVSPSSTVFSALFILVLVVLYSFLPNLVSS